MKNIFIALFCVIPIFYSCSKTVNAPTQAELNAVKLESLIQGVNISAVIIYNGQEQTDTGGPVQVDSKGFAVIQSTVYSLEDIKSFALSGTVLYMNY